jgi:NADH-quinone oxidoreductase subunit J
MWLDSVLFYAFAALILISAVLTITRRNVVHCAIFLIGALLGVAGLFLLQGAEFLAGVQIILYIGGVVVLYLFVIMLVPVSEEARQRRFANQKWLGLLAGAVLIAELGVLLSRGVGAFRLAEPVAPAALGEVGNNSETVGQVLFSEYLLPFELASILLLVAIIGAVVMAKVRPETG